MALVEFHFEVALVGGGDLEVKFSHFLQLTDAKRYSTEAICDVVVEGGVKNFIGVNENIDSVDILSSNFGDSEYRIL